MKALKTVTVILLLITVPVILESCCFSSCGCGFSNDGPPHYDFTGMTMRLFSRSNYTELPMGTTTLKEVSFDVDIEANFTSMIEQGSAGFAAHACSPAPEMANQQITSIVITSDKDMVASPMTIFAGGDLSILFGVSTEMNQGPIDEILNKQFLGRRLTFFSDAVLDSQQTHTFTFRVTLDNGTVYEMVTRELSLIAG